MSKIRKSKKYQDIASSVHSKFWNWSNGRAGKKLHAEIEDLKTLSFQAYKMAKFIEGQLDLRVEDKEPFVCTNDKHDVKHWDVISVRVKDRREVKRGECTKCPAIITDYGS